MLKKFLLCLAFCASFVSAQAQTTTDDEAINKLIADETTYFYNRQYKMWASCYVQSDYLRWTCAEPELFLNAQGWEQLSTMINNYMTENATPVNFKIVRTAQTITYNGNVAWVGFKALLVTDLGESNWNEFRLLEKNKEGAWQIAYMNSIKLVAK